MKKDYSRKIELFCPLCANKVFSYDDENEDSLIECVDCRRKFTRDEIKQANQENISNNLESVKKEVISDIREDFKKMFKGNKNLKLKL